MIAISESSLTRAWMVATDQLLNAGGEVFSLVVSIADPSEPAGSEADVRRYLDSVLTKARLQDTQTVANTIFPIALANGRSAERLYDTYSNKTFSVLRRFAPNRRGTYFLRMIKRDSQRHPKVVSRNPLDELIKKMRVELERGTGILRCAYELAVYDPLDDASVRMGFPCLSHVSLKLDPDHGRLHLTALYRNQQYIERAYGNFLGLARLQAFIARETELEVGELVCHATHAEVDHLGKRAVRDLLNKCREHLVGADGTGLLSAAAS
jgi:hypothetical protein